MMLFKNRFNPGIALLILCIFLSACGPSETEPLSGPKTEPLSGSKVIVFAWDGSNHGKYIHDVELMVSMLEEAGILAVVATLSEDSYQGSEPSLQSDILMQDINVTDYDGFLLPCFDESGPGDIEEDNVTAKLVEAASQNKPIAAQHLSVQLIGYIGLLDGIHYAGSGYLRDTFPEGIYEGDGVVQDGNIITSGCCSILSGCAEGTQELTQKLIDAVNP